MIRPPHGGPIAPGVRRMSSDPPRAAGKVNKNQMIKKAILVPILAIGSACTGWGSEWGDRLEELIPGLAMEPVEERYEYRMDIQSMAAQASRPGEEAARRELSRQLAAWAIHPSTPQPAKVWLVRQLEHIGDIEALGALTILLRGPDPELRECARRALEKNASPSATEELRRALDTSFETSWQIGLIHSLGERRDTKCVSLVGPFLYREETAFAAASALGKIATDEAVDALTRAWNHGNPVVGSALVQAAHELTQRGQPRKARVILKKLYRLSDVPALRIAAFAGLLKADADNTEELLKMALLENAIPMQHAAIRNAASESTGRRRTEVEQYLLEMPPETTVHALDIVGPEAESKVLTLTKSNNSAIRHAAFTTLARIGSAVSIPRLFEAAVQSPQDAADAQYALSRITGKGVGGMIRRIAAEGHVEERVVAIGALADRNDRDALPRLIQYAAEPGEETVHEAALKAVRSIGAGPEVRPLAELVVRNPSAAAVSALKAVAGRAQDRPAAAEAIAELSREADPAALAALIEVLGEMGGAEALAVVAAGLKSPAEEVQEASIRALGGWPEFSAANVLLSVAVDSARSERQRILAVRGMVRLVRRTGENEEMARRIALLKQALASAPRLEEKRLVLAALGSLPHPDAAATLEAWLENAELREEAAQAALKLAAAIRESHPELAFNLAESILNGVPDNEGLARSARQLMQGTAENHPEPPAK